MKKSKQIAALLNELLVINYETEKLFLCALEEVDNTLIKNFLRVTGYERHKFIQTLDSNIRQKGAIPVYPEDLVKSGSNLTSELKNILSTNDNKNLLTELGKKQVADIEKYQDTIYKFEFPEPIEKLLKNQQKELVQSLYSVAIHKDLLSRDTVS